MRKFKFVLLLVFTFGFIFLFNIPKTYAYQSPNVSNTYFLDFIQLSGEDEYYIYGTYIDGFPYSTKEAVMRYNNHYYLSALFVNTKLEIFQMYDVDNLGVAFPFIHFYYFDGIGQVRFLDNTFVVKEVQSISQFNDVVVPVNYENDYYRGYNKGFDRGIDLGYSNGSFDYGYYDSNEDELLNAFDYGMSQFYKGKDEGYNEGYEEARDFYADEGTFGGILSYVLKPFEILTYEVFPNITIGTIVLIPIIFGLIAFLFRLRGK